MLNTSQPSRGGGREGEPRPCGTFEGWGGVQPWRSSQAGGKALLPVPASFGIRQSDPWVGKGRGRGTWGRVHSASHSMENLEGKRRNDRGRRQRLFPKQLQGLWQSLAVGNSSQGPGIAKVTPPLFCDEEKHSEGDQKKLSCSSTVHLFIQIRLVKFYTHTFCGGGRLFWEKKGDFGGGERGGKWRGRSSGV